MFSDRLKRRADKISEWLRENHPEIKKVQAHLQENTPERAYWHYGYEMAIRDITGLMDEMIADMPSDVDSR